MASNLRVGHVKTFSSGLGSGSVEIKHSGNQISLPFSSQVIAGTHTQLRSGDRVRVSLSSGKNKKPRVVAIEAAPDQSAADSTAVGYEPEASMTDSSSLTTNRVSVREEGGTQARFTVQNFVRSGSRLDFG